MIVNPKKPFGSKKASVAGNPPDDTVAEKAPPPAPWAEPDSRSVLGVPIILYQECPVMSRWRRFLAWAVEWPRP